MILTLKNIKLHVLCFFLLAAGFHTHAQQVRTPLVHNYSMQDYNADHQNWSVACRNDGMVFFGNNEGILMTDGAHWNLISLPGKSIVRSVAIDDDNMVYAGGFEEFGYFEKDETGRFSYHSISSKLDKAQLHNEEFWRIIPMGKNIYFQSFSSIYRFDGTEVHPVNFSGSVVLLLKAGERLFIDVIDSGLHELRNDSLIALKGLEPLKNDEIKLVLPSGKDRLLIGGAKKGLFLYNGHKAVPWKIPAAESIRDAEINNGILLDEQFFIGTIVEGLYVLDKNGTLLYQLKAENALQHNTVLAMGADPVGNLWLGLNRGVSHIIRNDILTYYPDPFGELGTIFDAAWYEGQLWLGTNLGLLRLTGNATIGQSNIELVEGSQGQVWDLFKIDNELLVGHTSGTYRLKNGLLTEISSVNGGFDMQLFDDGNEKVLIQSTYSSINIYRHRNGNWQFNNPVSGIIEPFSRFEIDPYGNIWAAHLHRNIFRIKLNETMDSIVAINTFGMDEGFPEESNISVAKINNRVVFPTGKGIYTYDDLIDTIIPYNRLNEALGNVGNAEHILPGSRNIYWFISGQQISAFRIEDSNIDSLFFYDLSMQGIQLGSTFPGIAAITPKSALICLDKGFAIYEENDSMLAPVQENAIFRSIIASNSSEDHYNLPIATGNHTITIPYVYRNLSFIYSSFPHYKVPRYRYRMIGIDDKWGPWSEQSASDYARIPAGKYTFQVQTCNIHHHPGPITTYRFNILPPWYLSNVAIIIYVLFLAGVVILIRALFIRRLKLYTLRIEKEEQKKREEEILRAEQEFISLKNDLLQKDLDNRNNQLADYTMSIIRKNEILIKVKEELQKQKKEMGDRYPNYLVQNLMKLLDASISPEDEWKVFEYHFDQTRDNFFRRLRQDYPDLTPGDLKLCAYLRMNLSSKELAPLLNISPKSVEVHRSRLRKKLNLHPNDNLVEFLLTF